MGATCRPFMSSWPFGGAVICAIRGFFNSRNIVIRGTVIGTRHDGVFSCISLPTGFAILQRRGQTDMSGIPEGGKADLA